MPEKPEGMSDQEWEARQHPPQEEVSDDGLGEEVQEETPKKQPSNVRFNTLVKAVRALNAKVNALEDKVSTPKPFMEVVKLPALISLIMAIVVFMAMGVFGGGSFVLKKDFNTNITNMANSIGANTKAISAQQPVLDGLTTTVNNAVNTAIGNATKGISDKVTSNANQLVTNTNAIASLTSSVDANTKALQAVQSASDKNTTDIGLQAATVQNNTNAIKTNGGTITSMQKTITDLTNEVNTLQTQVVALATPTPTTAAQAITASVKTMSGAMYPSSNTTLVASFRVQLTNNTAKDITDIVLGIQAQTSGIIGTSVPTYTLSGGNTNWQIQGYNSVGAYFVNSNWGLTVKANSTLTLYLSLTITNPAGGFLNSYYQMNGVPYQIDAQVQ